MDAQALPAMAVALMALGTAYAFASAERACAMNRAFSGGVACLGLAVALNGAGRAPLGIAGLLPWAALTETAALLLFWEWTLGVLHTAATPPPAARRIARSAQSAALVYGVLAVAFPELRAAEFLGFAAAPPWRALGFWLFAIPVGFAAGAGVVLLARYRRRLDAPERVRAGAFALAIPPILAAYALTPPLSHLSAGLGLTVMLAGAVRYHVALARHAFALAHFLSPQVARLVQQQGLRAAMRERRIELTAVCCDLRGFTRYAQAQEPEYLVQFLRDYYQRVGQIASEAGGSVKDFAGDGALILVGAPAPLADHAARGIHLARRLGVAIDGLTRRWSLRGQALGVGIGVATGPVMVGVIASAARYEYVAIGMAVNLAVRLCDQARPGELLVHCDSLRAAPADPASREAVADQLLLPGFSQPVCYARLGFGPARAAA